MFRQVKIAGEVRNVEFVRAGAMAEQMGRLLAREATKVAFVQMRKEAVGIPQVVGQVAGAAKKLFRRTKPGSKPIPGAPLPSAPVSSGFNLRQVAQQAPPPAPPRGGPAPNVPPPPSWVGGPQAGAPQLARASSRPASSPAPRRQPPPPPPGARAAGEPSGVVRKPGADTALRDLRGEGSPGTLESLGTEMEAKRKVRGKVQSAPAPAPAVAPPPPAVHPELQKTVNARFARGADRQGYVAEPLAKTLADPAAPTLRSAKPAKTLPMEPVGVVQPPAAAAAAPAVVPPPAAAAAPVMPAPKGQVASPGERVNMQEVMSQPARSAVPIEGYDPGMAAAQGPLLQMPPRTGQVGTFEGGLARRAVGTVGDAAGALARAPGAAWDKVKYPLYGAAGVAGLGMYGMGSLANTGMQAAGQALSGGSHYPMGYGQPLPASPSPYGYVTSPGVM